jgi:thioredoxin-like negative regulator of GroEL
MLIRLLIAAALVGLGLGVYLLGKRWQIARAASASRLLGQLRPGTPGIVYFWSETCAPCELVQKPALAQIESEMGNAVQVIPINALQQPQIADEWGVFSVPTTFIVDESGHPRHVNYGVVQATQLRQQLQSL